MSKPCTRVVQRVLRCSIAGVAFLYNLPLGADTPRSRAEIAALVDKALPVQIGGDNSVLVRKMLDARFGRPIIENFDAAAALKTVFGSQTPKLDPECQRKATPTADPSPEDCTAILGKLAGREPYIEFGWSRNLGFGDLRLLRREADGSVLPGKMPPVRLGDAEAFGRGTTFLVRTMGLPPEEFAPRLPGARTAFPVRTLSIGQNGPRGKLGVTPIMKLLKMPRSVLFELPQAVGGVTTMRIRAPGEAFVLMNDAGIVMARVNNWVELAKSPVVDPGNAKKRAELVEEITDTLMEEDAESVAGIRARLVINDSDPASPSLLLPAVRVPRVVAPIIPGVEVSVSAVPRDPTEAEQARLGPTTAGHTHQFALVRLGEAKATADD